MKVKALTLMIILTAAMSGCLGATAEEMSEPEMIWEMESVNETHSYQFWNVNPMSVANETEIAVNGSVMVWVNWSWMFHEPVLWDKGNMSMELVVTEGNESRVVWEESPNSSKAGANHSEIWVNGTLTLRTYGTGSDNPTDNLPADYYAAYWCVEVYRQVEA